MVTRSSDGAGWERRRRSPRTTVDVADDVPLAAPAEEVYERLLDVETAALCLPGLVPGSLAKDGVDSFRAVVKQTVIGVPATWRLRTTMQPDPATRRLTIGLEGDEPRLGLHLVGAADVVVRERPTAACALEYTGHVEVEGRLAATGAPIINRLVDETLRSFVAALGTTAPPQPEPPPHASLVRASLPSGSKTRAHGWSRFFHAASSHSWTRPPRTSRRWTRRG